MSSLLGRDAEVMGREIQPGAAPEFASEAISGGKLIGVFTQRDASVEEPQQNDLFQVGTASHIPAEVMKAMAGVDMTHVPYKISPQAIQDVAALGTLKNTSVFSPLFSSFGPDPIHERLRLGMVSALAVNDSLTFTDLRTMARHNYLCALVVDDEERMVRFIRMNLEHDGFQVSEAFNGKQAIQRLLFNACMLA